MRLFGDKKDANILTFLCYIALSSHVLIKYIPINTRIIVGFSLVIVIFVFLYSLRQNTKINLSTSIGKYKIGMLFVILLMIIATLIQSCKYDIYNNIGYFAVDIIAMVVFLCGDSFITDYSINRVINLVFVFGIISSVLGAYALAVSNFHITIISDRSENVGYIQYYLWKLMECWPFLILALTAQWKTLKNRTTKWIISIFLFIEYFVLSLLFMKRVVFFDILVLIIVLFLIYAKHFNKIFKALALITILGLLVYYTSIYIFNFDIITYISLTLSRFQKTELQDYDRIQEFNNLFKQYGSLFLFTGMGFGSWHNGPGGVNLHIGIANFVFKGGLFFGALMFVQFFKAFRIVVSPKVASSKKICSAIIVYTFLRSIVSPLWQPNPTRIILSICIILMLNQYDNLFKKGVDEDNEYVK